MLADPDSEFFTLQITCSQPQHYLFLLVDVRGQLVTVEDQERFHCSVSNSLIPVNRGGLHSGANRNRPGKMASSHDTKSSPAHNRPFSQWPAYNSHRPMARLGRICPFWVEFMPA